MTLLIGRKKERDGFVFTEINTVVNAFHIEAIEQMAEMARAIGKNDDAEAFEARAELAKSVVPENAVRRSSGNLSRRCRHRPQQHSRQLLSAGVRAGTGRQTRWRDRVA